MEYTVYVIVIGDMKCENYNNIISNIVVSTISFFSKKYELK